MLSHKNTLGGAKEALAEILSYPQEGDLGKYCRMCDEFSTMKFALHAIQDYRFWKGDSDRLQEVEALILQSKNLVFSDYIAVIRRMQIKKEKALLRLVGSGKLVLLSPRHQKLAKKLLNPPSRLRIVR
jgi:hypothetical protein